MALLGFLLTTVAGTIIGWAFQHFEDLQKDKREGAASASKLIENRRIAATTLFADVSTLIDKRLYLWREAVWDLEQNGKDPGFELKRHAYHLVVEEWNFSLNRNRALLCRYFWSECRRDI
jgi:hypothetical protein